MSRRGFQLETVFCETCGEAAEGIPDTFEPDGLPVGWVALRVQVYEERSDGERPTRAAHDRSLFYCSQAHLPAELLPEPEEATA